MDTIFILKKTPKNVLHVKQRNVKKNNNSFFDYLL